MQEADAASALVPSRRQYLSLKSQYPDAILLYRMGDFYETFDDDAAVAARAARITLTSRSFGKNGRVPMAGIPHHALNHYLTRLLAAGHTVAIAEQLSEPGRGLVERAVTRVVTPGTVADGSLLPPAENRFLAAVSWRQDRVGLAWADVSTGEFAVTELAGVGAGSRVEEYLARLDPAECLVSGDLDVVPVSTGRAHLTRVEPWQFEPARARATLLEHFGTQTLSPFGCEDLAAGLGAAGAIVAYLQRTNARLLPLLSGLRMEFPERYVALDASTRRNLELTRSFGTGGSRGSLLGVLDLTCTAMGARILRRLIGQPLRDLDLIRRRQALVAVLVGEPRSRAALRRDLARLGDLERLVGRITQGNGAPRDFLALSGALQSLPVICARLTATGANALSGLARSIDPCAELAAMLKASIEETEEGAAAIRRGFSVELDGAIEAARETRSWLTSLEREERARTGIKSLKVGFNKVFGYYIEVTRPNLGLVPSHYARKQTVANGERFITERLKEAEARLLAADDEIEAFAQAALTRLADEVRTAAARLRASAEKLAELDALVSLAEVADRGGWVRPQVDESDVLEIVGGRHPVVEASLAGEPFIANDCLLGGAGTRQAVITGPNMGGKSTYLRQVALIVMLAQIGSFVPARQARVGLVDRIFTRIGAHDDLAAGASTFMVEMVETATILQQATDRSLVILDEVGRGTSTHDGRAIGQAVLEDLHDRVRARTLFATHFLELTELADRLPSALNLHVAALERDGRVVFLYAVQPGAADQAYGVHVARLAGLPFWVADRADEILASLRRATTDDDYQSTVAATPEAERAAEARARYDLGPAGQLTLNGFPSVPEPAEQIARELRELSLRDITPGQAIDWLIEQQSRLRGSGIR